MVLHQNSTNSPMSRTPLLYQLSLLSSLRARVWLSIPKSRYINFPSRRQNRSNCRPAMRATTSRTGSRQVKSDLSRAMTIMPAHTHQPHRAKHANRTAPCLLARSAQCTATIRPKGKRCSSRAHATVGIARQAAVNTQLHQQCSHMKEHTSAG